jgi:adenosylcobinamide-GDP ribazoletransferase
MRYYPLVGAVLGILSAGLLTLALRGFSTSVAVVTAVIGLILFSGALHLDGFADMCDGFYGHHERDRILAIMKDSHSGAMAIVGVFCLLALKIALLVSLPATRTVSALILAPTLGRWSMVWLSESSTYARPERGTASSYIGHVNRQTLLIATFLCAGIASRVLKAQGLEVMVLAAVFTRLFRRYTERRIGGMTGDTLGACSELVEVFTLALLCLDWTAFTL